MEIISLIGVGSITKKYETTLLDLGVSVKIFHRDDCDDALNTDGVCILTEPQYRLPLVKKFVNLPTIVEKPLAKSYDEAKRILDIKPNIYTAFQSRYDENYIKTKNKLNDISVACADLIFPRNRDYFENRPWRKEIKPMMNQGIHLIDTFIWWFGKPTRFKLYDSSLEILHTSGVLSVINLSLKGKSKYEISLDGSKLPLKLPNHKNFLEHFLARKEPLCSGLEAMEIFK